MDKNEKLIDDRGDSVPRSNDGPRESMPPFPVPVLFLLDSPSRAFCRHDLTEVDRVIVGRARELAFTRDGGNLSIGVDDKGMSGADERHPGHAQFERRKRSVEWYVRDLDSTNGTFLNGERIARRVEIDDGDRITTAGTTFVFKRVEPCDEYGSDFQQASTASSSPDDDRLVTDGWHLDGHELARDELVRIAQSDASVLLLGETGSGKDEGARWIHNRSKRAASPFVPVDCGTIPENLIESELFGHARGSFTGAVETTTGRFVRANGGTIFLDEIGNASASLQMRLLRFLQERACHAVGGSDFKVDVRIIAATNRDLCQDIAADRFREDLYFRLGAHRITVPPLRDRPRLLKPLALSFLRAFLVAPCLPGEALERLKGYDWPGNIRELKDVIERAKNVSGGGMVQAEHLGELTNSGRGRATTPAQSATLSGGRTWEERIESALIATRGNIEKTARELERSDTFVRKRIKQNPHLQDILKQARAAR